MAFSTLKTILGFLRESFARYTPYTRKADSLNDIYNYLHVDGIFPTSGQPDENQLRLIAEQGYKTVINLAPTSVLENSVIDERRILSELGVEYIHQPVNFKNPTDQDFFRFVEAVEEVQSKLSTSDAGGADKLEDKLWVHCAANMRVSAFTYRYRTKMLNHNPELARKDLEKIWQPIGVWKEFI